MEIIQIEIEKQNWVGWYCNNVGEIIQIQKKLVHHESSFGNGIIHFSDWLYPMINTKSYFEIIKLNGPLNKH
jgi:hypothetical protein